MAGHSKWKQIKHYKAATDAKRGAHFTKLIREITMAAKLGGGDPAGNPRLRTAIDTAKAASMPKENIERAVKKGTGDLEGVHYTEVTYEGYGPGGVAILIFSLTDNPTRTVADIRHRLSRLGGNLGAAHSVSYLFERKGQIYIDGTKYEEDKVLEAALDAGAEDFAAENDQYIVTTDPHQLHAVQKGLENAGFKIDEAEIAHIPKSTVFVEGKNAESLVKLLEELEDLDDVQKVSANFDMDVAQMSGA
jgi:YebC/PmpR family DNA-binding regulatory protein